MISWFFKYNILFALIIKFLFESIILTLVVAYKIFATLLYSNFSASIFKPLFVKTSPPLYPLKTFPFWVISISETLNLKTSLEYEKFVFIKDKHKTAKYKKILFFINFK